MATEIAQRNETREMAASQSPTPAMMLQAAIERGTDMDQLTKLMDLQERWEANEARKAFQRAFADFKAEAVTILKGTKIKDGPLKGKYHADLFDVISATTEPLARHGLTISWKTIKDEKDWMEVACTLKHDAGHSETESMGGAPDAGPGRNAIQARGSTRTYLQRYTAMAILGLAAKDMDDDGRTAAPDPINSEQHDTLMAKIEATNTDLKKFCAAYGIEELRDLPASRFNDAMTKLAAKAKRRD